MGQLGVGETIAWNPRSKEPPAEAQAGWRLGDGIPLLTGQEE